jgi:hypothetical protein
LARWTDRVRRATIEAKHPGPSRTMSHFIMGAATLFLWMQEFPLTADHPATISGPRLCSCGLCRRNHRRRLASDSPALHPAFLRYWIGSRSRFPFSKLTNCLGAVPRCSAVAVGFRAESFKAQLQDSEQLRHLLDVSRRAAAFSSRPPPPAMWPCCERFPRYR